MSASMEHSGPSPPAPIMKHSRRKWQQLSVKGDSVGIGDPTLGQGYLGHLEKKTKLQLQELLCRQEKLLGNTAFVTKLKDKGNRLRERREEIQLALDKVVSDQELTATILPNMTDLEWQWRGKPKSTFADRGRHDDNARLDHPLHSDEEIDPLELLVSHSSDIPLTKRSAMNQSDEIESDDPAEAIREELRKLEISEEREEGGGEEVKGNKKVNQQATNDLLATDFGSKLLISLEKKRELKPIKEVFKPFRLRNKQCLLDTSSSATVSPTTATTDDSKSSCSTKQATPPLSTTAPAASSAGSCHPTFGVSATPEFPSLKKINLHKSPLWLCESSATGPLSFSLTGCERSAKLIPLSESLELQHQYHERIKQIKWEEMAARMAKINAKGSCSSGSGAVGKGSGGKKLSSRMMAYRDKNATTHLLEQDFDDGVRDGTCNSDDDDSDDESSDSDDGNYE